MDFEEFRELPDEAKSIALFSEVRETKQKMERLPIEVAEAVTRSVAARFVPVDECIHKQQSKTPPSDSGSWLNPKTIGAGLIGLGLMFGAAYKEIGPNPTSAQENPSPTTVQTQPRTP
jgi:hypothetical protein